MPTHRGWSVSPGATAFLRACTNSQFSLLMRQFVSLRVVGNTQLCAERNAWKTALYDVHEDEGVIHDLIKVSSSCGIWNGGSRWGEPCVNCCCVLAYVI